MDYLKILREYGDLCAREKAIESLRFKNDKTPTGRYQEKTAIKSLKKIRAKKAILECVIDD